VRSLSEALKDEVSAGALRSPAKAIAEIQRDADEFKFRFLFFDDDTITMDQDWFNEFFTLYGQRFSFPFYCNLRPGTLTQPMARLLQAAGAKGVALGIETFREFRKALALPEGKPDKIICHQVGASHQRTILDAIGIPVDRDFTTFRYLGNVGTVSLPITAAIAHERGLGVGDPREIELVGDDVSSVNWGFQVGNNFHRTLAWFAWYGPTKFLQKLVLHTPLVAFPIMISKVNHDYIHWPLKESHIYERWLQETTWGKLFQRYQQGQFSGI
jgi:hypothetical protein